MHLIFVAYDELIIASLFISNEANILASERGLGSISLGAFSDSVTLNFGLEVDWLKTSAFSGDLLSLSYYN